MKRLPFTEGDEVAAAVEAASEVVASGGVVLLPTESYYGLGADPRNRTAVERVFALKARPAAKELPVVCSDWRQVESLVRIPDAHRVKLGRIWPAALSAVARCREPVPASSTGTLAVRLPDHALLRALIYRVGPLTATSANRHGEPPCTEVDAALASLIGVPELVLDGGTLTGGMVSTMVDLTADPPRVIRPGPVAWEEEFDPEMWQEIKD
jgi:L-threonylcarbamoyladenylate synthase